MKRLLLTLAFCLATTAAFGACSSTDYANGFTCIQEKVVSGATNTNTNTATLSAFTAGHTAIACGYACYNSSCGGNSGQMPGMGLTMADGAGDTLTASPGTPFKLVGSGKDSFIAGCWITNNVSATTTFTATCSGGGGVGTTCSYVTLWVSEWIGAAGWDKDAAFNNASTASNGSLALAAGTNATDLVLGFITTGSNPAITPGAGFTEIGEDVAGVEHEAKSVVNGTAGQTCTWSWTGSTTYDALCVSAKAAVGGGAAPNMPPAVY